ncbi:MAG TPA: hypothetical protein VFG68_21775 [Fimbriiglobus sp.]|nr:hypothetical protein [Fimbriiglobus sp.]
MAGQRKKNEDALPVALACGATVEAAARQCRLSERTVYRRLGDDGFRKRLAGVRADMVQRAAGMLSAAGMESVRTLLELQKPGVAAPVRLGAARAVLEIGMKLREVVDLEARLAALEEQLARSNAD